jgi:hypothetical protein
MTNTIRRRLRLAAIMTSVSLLTFLVLMETYKFLM